MAKSKEGGADVIESYVFWNGHEPERGQVQNYISPRYPGSDLVLYRQLCI